jgi:ABC-2 type transport system ATP-binding protein
VLLVTHELDETELLCEHVVAMRAGRVLDQGTPAELVARHAPEVTVRFGLVAVDLASIADTLQTLNRLPGVTGVTRDRGDVVIRGTREVIAQVGAWLVGTRRPVPADLRVAIPDLEAALLTLLDNDHTDQMGRAAS